VIAVDCKGKDDKRFQIRYDMEYAVEMWRAVEFTGMNVQYLCARMDVTDPYNVKDIDVFVHSFVMEM
jgi:hypothetical protein